MTRRFLVWLLAGAASLPAQVRPLTILHSNDIHAHLLPDQQGNGGLARLATAVRIEEKGCGACLYLNAGDLVQGTPVSTIFNGKPLYEIGNLMGFDVSTLGNHEFDYGWKRVREFARIARFPIVSANVVDEQGRSITGKPYVIREVGGLRVGIIGEVLGDLVGNSVSPAAVGPFKVMPVVETVRKLAAELRDKTDLIVVLGHLHDKEEVLEILRQVPEVAVVVAGHTHVEYGNMMVVNGHVAVLVNGYADELGRLDLQVDVAKKDFQTAAWRVIPVEARLEPAPDVDAAVKKWEGRVTGIVDVGIGTSARAMAQKSPELIALVEKAMAEETHADFAWIDGGNLRDGLPAGPLLARHVWNVLPFQNRLLTGKFRGRELPKAITERYPVEADRIYTVTVTDFTEANQATDLKTTGLKFPKKGPDQRNAVIAWIRKQKTVGAAEATGARAASR